MTAAGASHDTLLDYAYTGHGGAVAASTCDQQSDRRQRPSPGRLQLPGVRLASTSSMN
jgi:hypothetical protein